MSENVSRSISQTHVSDEESAVLSVRDARVTFDMSRGVSRVLDDISLDVQRDEILGVVGESGSGKSMLANAMMNSVVDPGELSGEVIYRPGDGGNPVDITTLDEDDLQRLRWEELSMVFQGAMSSFNPTMRIRGHFEETLESHGHDLDEGMARAERLLDDVFLEADRVLDSYPHELSGGMKQRALIALSLILEPEVLVMDEPTASLDLLMQRSIISLLESLKEEYDLTLVFITHDLPLVTRLSDRIAVLYAFDLAEIGTTDQILRSPTHPYTRKLLKTTPNLDTGLDSIETIEGSSPDPVNTPSGCAFHPRCPLADGHCETTDPELEPVTEEGSHRTACHHWDQAAEAIPFDITDAHESGIEIGSVSKTATADATGTASDDRSEEPLLTLDDLHIEFEKEGGILDIFSDNEVVQAVSGVDLSVYENDVVAIVGESGCGKTTLGKAAIGLHRPAEGSVTYRGQDIWAAREGGSDVDIPFDEIRTALQIIHQDPGSALNKNKRVLSTLERPLKKWHPEMDRDDRESRIYTLLEEVGMSPPTDYAQRYPHQLSGGEKQRVALIRALLMNPDLILGDEAISALDVSLRVDMMDLFLELQELFNTSYLFISHDLANANYLAQRADGRIAVMYLGEIVEVGPVEQIIHNPQHPYTQILRWATPNLDPDQDEAGDVPIRNIDIPDPEDPPSGCRFHTRCPDAREACTRENPDEYALGSGHEVSCFRVVEDHDYWDSEPLASEDVRAAASDD
ncbi:ABC transporter ATP-binding protein [Halosimplex sp. TS25]|uniref:ABC transporter ATP-binding protein n=1 Tax=Halosimplex rarum TaxID=3396619 RepID=UPI0039E9E07C